MSCWRQACWRPASLPRLTGRWGQRPRSWGPGRSRTGAVAIAQPELPAVSLPPPEKNRSICRDPTEILLFPVQSARKERVAGPTRKSPGLGRRRNEGPRAGGISSCASPSTRERKCDGCAFQAQFPGVTSPSRPGRGEQTKRRGRQRGDPRGGRRGVRGAGQYRKRGRIAGPAAGGGAWPMERRVSGAALRRRHLNGRRRDAPHSVRPPRTGRPSVPQARSSPSRGPHAEPGRFWPWPHTAPRVESAGPEGPPRYCGERRRRRVHVCVWVCVYVCVGVGKRLPRPSRCARQLLMRGRGPALPG